MRTTDEQVEKIIEALKEVRAPLLEEESTLHQLVAQALRDKGIAFIHEARIGTRCRIDFLVEENIGLELKKGKPNKKQLLEQLKRYVSAPEIERLMVVVERWVDLPGELKGKPVHLLSTNRLWGIALP